MNTVRCSDERTRVSSGREKWYFKKFINDCNLLEFDREGLSYRYSNIHTPPSFSRLDYFIANNKWWENFQVHIEKSLNFYCLDP